MSPPTPSPWRFSADSLYKVVYLPTKPSDSLESFAAPVLNLHDSHVNAPFFGPNVWTAVVQPVPGGNIPTQVAAVELKLTFKDGGAFDFHSTFERIKERLQQAVDVAREGGHLAGDQNGSVASGLQGVNLDYVHLDELPAYEAATEIHPPALNQSSQAEPAPLIDFSDDTEPPAETSRQVPPSAPPGYEEVQRESIADALERRLRQDS
jgi:hypothetical protein